MCARRVLRLLSLLMLLSAAVFVFCVLCCPTLGRVVQIGGFSFGPAQWRVCYAIYAVLTAGLFLASFPAGGRKPDGR